MSVVIEEQPKAYMLGANIPDDQYEDPLLELKVSLALWVAEEISRNKPKRNRLRHFPRQIQCAVDLFRQMGATEEARDLVRTDLIKFYSENPEMDIPTVRNPDI